jgi:hypothetical protein
MKYIVLISIIFSFFSCNRKENLKANLIEKTRFDGDISNLEIQNLMVKMDTFLRPFVITKPSEFKSEYSLENCKFIADSLEINESVIKEDFDNNGYTDLLVTGTYYGSNFVVYIIYSFGKDKFEIQKLINGHFDRGSYPKLIYIDNLPAIELYNQRPSRYKDPNPKKIIDKKTLLYKYGGFVEFNKNPRLVKVEKIKYESTGCMGTCPVFDIEINMDATSFFIPKYFNFDTEYQDEEALLKTTIREKELNEIKDLLNYIDFTNLREEYGVPWTDDQEGIFEITYNNGKTKRIRDYGMIGTYGLNLLHTKMTELRFNQKWQK